ncbi:MAG: sulfate ABC transporter substrate-binding protein [Dehalococcoidia bacterium]|nr:sulfate ABC transporter substrate-binding protein [Dehalococcoidia bacterium]
MKNLKPLILITILPVFLVLVACSSGSEPQSTSTAPVSLQFGSHSTPQEVYNDSIIPAFQKYWKDKNGQTVKFNSSFLGSGTQSRAVIAGFEADLVHLALEPDVANIAKAGLITHDWQANEGGIISNSIAVLAVRQGNPKGIKDWSDLAKPGLKILTHDPKTSGGAQWNISAIYGAALRGKVTGVVANDPAAAQQFLSSVLKNVMVFDRDARTSITNFESGLGEVAITYENEVKTSQKAGKDIEYVIPSSTIIIENPAALVDTYVDKHGTRTVAAGFIEFLRSTEGQRLFAANGFRPKGSALLAEFSSGYPTVQDGWKIDYLGGWPKVVADVFGDGGIYQKALAASR